MRRDEKRKNDSEEDDRSEEERKRTEEEMGRIEGEGKVRKRRTEPKIDLKNRKSIV